MERVNGTFKGVPEDYQSLVDYYQALDTANVAYWRAWIETLPLETPDEDAEFKKVPLISRRGRLLKDTTPLQRGIIRHLIIVLDLSMTTAEKDLRPSRYLLSIKYAQEFVQEYFEQNPISQLGFIGLRDGLAVRISDLSGNPNDHVEALQKLKALEPAGDASLQNALEMARGLL